MSEAKPIPVRLSEEVIKRLDAVALKSGLDNRTAVIKLCIGSFLDHFEKAGTAALPLDWKEVLKIQDGRTHRYAVVAEANGHGNTVIINHGTKPAHYTKSKPKKRKAP